MARTTTASSIVSSRWECRRHVPCPLPRPCRRAATCRRYSSCLQQQSSPSTVTNNISHNVNVRYFPTTIKPWRRSPTTYSMGNKPPSLLFAIRRHFSGSDAVSTASSTSSALFTKGTTVGMLLFLLTICSDPVINAFEDFGDDENESYWMDKHQQNLSEKNSRGTGGTRDSKLQGTRLRNAHKHFGDVNGNDITEDTSAMHNQLPKYSKVVIVGGGMAGLHTALALAERMNDPTCRDANPPSSPTTTKPRTKRSRDKHSSGVVVLDASRIGNGASGRSKGLAVPGFQVPLENLRENSFDAGARGGSRASVPALVRSMSDSPRHTDAVAEEMYDLSNAAMDRLRSIVKKYDIDCDWMESGAVEGSIHPVEEEEDGRDEEDDGCQILTPAQVDEIMGRPRNGKNDNNLYKWGEYDPSCAGVNPLALTMGLADAAEKWGVKVYERAEVTRLEKCTISREGGRNEHPPTSGKYAIVTDRGHTISCDHVVLCTGAEKLSTKVSRMLSHSFVPVYTWMAATEPLHERCPLKDGVSDRVLPSESNDGDNHEGNSSDDDPNEKRERPAPMCGDDHVSLNYWRREDDDKGEGRLLFGSLADTFSFPKWMISWRLRNALAEVYPQLFRNEEDVRFDRVWGGKLAFALNAMPLIGRDTDYDHDSRDRASVDADEDDTENAAERSVADGGGGVWYATGFAGHGIVPTALAGSLLADALLEVPDRQQWRLFHTYFPPVSWNGYPFSRLGVGTVLCVYNSWDWLGKMGLRLPPLPKLW